MVRELRDVALLVAQWQAALEMPDTIRHRDELARRYAATAFPAPRSDGDRDIDPDFDRDLDGDFEAASGTLLTAVEDDDLPLYY